jgi:hypothetical protein
MACVSEDFKTQSVIQCQYTISIAGEGEGEGLCIYTAILTLTLKII